MMAMVSSGFKAQQINSLLEKLHDRTVSNDPFEWQSSERDLQNRREIWEKISELFGDFIYAPDKLLHSLLFLGIALPILAIAIIFIQGIKVDGNLWYALWIIAILSLTGRYVNLNPEISQSMFLASYAIPRNWAFAQCNGQETWKAMKKRFVFFHDGDDDQSIPIRIWGKTDKGKAFQIFYFRYTTGSGNSTTWHYRFGMFIAAPWCKVRARITETGDNAGLEKLVKLEYGRLNRATKFYCNSKDEFELVKLMSLKAQEVLMKLSDELGAMNVDLYPDMVLVTTNSDFMHRIKDIRSNEELKSLAKFPGNVDWFYNLVVDGIEQIEKDLLN